MIEVKRLSSDKLAAKIWRFQRGASGEFLMLTFYMEGARATTRHKFAGPFWSSTDERSHNSKLPRPTAIPRSVAVEAISLIPPPMVTIGWATRGHIAAITDADQ